MQLSERLEGEAAIVAMNGKLDTVSAAQVMERLSEIVAGGARKLLVNMERVMYISSAGLRVLLATAKELNKVDGELRVCSLNEVVQECFKISGFSDILNVFENEEKALDNF